MINSYHRILVFIWYETPEIIDSETVPRRPAHGCDFPFKSGALLEFALGHGCCPWRDEAQVQNNPGDQNRKGSIKGQ